MHWDCVRWASGSQGWASQGILQALCAQALRRSSCPEVEASDASRDHEWKGSVFRAAAAVVPRAWIRGLVDS